MLDGGSWEMKHVTQCYVTKCCVGRHMTAASHYRYIDRIKIMAEIERRILYFHACIPSFPLSYLLSFFTDNLAYKEKWVEQKTQSRKWMERYQIF